VKLTLNTPADVMIGALTLKASVVNALLFWRCSSCMLMNTPAAHLHA